MCSGESGIAGRDFASRLRVRSAVIGVVNVALGQCFLGIKGIRPAQLRDELEAERPGGNAEPPARVTAK
jgi:hypothetical protein